MKLQNIKFRKRDNDIFALLISEKTQIPIETLKWVALENAKKIEIFLNGLTEV